MFGLKKTFSRDHRNNIAKGKRKATLRRHAEALRQQSAPAQTATTPAPGRTGRRKGATGGVSSLAASHRVAISKGLKKFYATSEGKKVAELRGKKLSKGRRGIKHPVKGRRGSKHSAKGRSCKR